jgi:hypothetical protein
MLSTWGECFWTARDLVPRPAADRIWFSGAISEIAIYDRALTPEQVAERIERQVTVPIWRVVATTLLTQALLVALAAELWFFFARAG